MRKTNTRERKLRFPVKAVLIGILSLICILSPLFFLVRYLTTSDYFRVKDSEYFTGQNIFKVNLQREAQRLRHMYPDYKRVALRRSLPNKIIVDFIPRQAVALLRLSDDFYLDEEGILFHPPGQAIDNSQLPLIVGLRSRISDPRSGVKYNENSLLRILEFIDNLNKDLKLAERLKIKKVNLANINDIFLITITGCKINLGGIGSLNKDLSILRRLNSEIDFDLTKIQYIDLRFREPAVKYR